MHNNLGRLKRQHVLAIIVASTVLVFFFSLGLGQYSIPPERALYILLHPFTSGEAGAYEVEHQVIWFIRMPRILTALCAGGALALCGAALQGVFYNPLVDPHIIGVTSGAAFGGTLAILFGVSPLLLMGSAFAFGLTALLCVYAIASLVKHKSNLVLVLAGVILNGFFRALVSLLQYIADSEEKLPSIVFWLMGSFATANWNKLLLFAVPLVIGGYVLLRLRWHINVLSIGDSQAKAMGMPVVFTRWTILIMCTLIVSAQVAVSGSIGWVGLIIPHLARMIAGVDHRQLLPVSLWLGGIFMIITDDLARMLTTAEIPLGILTAIIGGPVFTLLLLRKDNRA